MVSIKSFRKMALAFPEATEEAHFEKTSFRVKKKSLPLLMIKTKGLVLNYQQ